jgi:hypothetical protein
VASLAHVHTIILHGKFLLIPTLRIPMQNTTHVKVLFLHALKCRYDEVAAQLNRINGLGNFVEKNRMIDQ